MGSNFTISEQRLRAIAWEIEGQIRIITKVSDEVQDIKKKLSYLSEMKEVCRTLNILVGQVRREAIRMQIIYESVDRIIRIYGQQEKEICSRVGQSKKGFGKRI